MSDWVCLDDPGAIDAVVEQWVADVMIDCEDWLRAEVPEASEDAIARGLLRFEAQVRSIYRADLERLRARHMH